MKNIAMTLSRFTRLENLLNLAFIMQARADGVSLSDIQQEYGVSRRTAERMRDSLCNVFYVEQMETGERIKKWKIPYGKLNPMINFNAEELSELQRAIDMFRRDHIPEDARHLRQISNKISALLKPAVKRRVETEIEVLNEAEGLALRPGPHPQN